MDLFEATDEYVRFRNGELSTEYRYLQRRATDTPIRLARGPTWGASFTGSGYGQFHAVSHIAVQTEGTIDYTVSFHGSSLTVYGTGTNWDSDLVGMAIFLGGSNAVALITSVASPTQLAGTVYDAGLAGSYAAQPYRIGPVYVRAANYRADITAYPNDFVSVDK